MQLPCFQFLHTVQIKCVNKTYSERANQLTYKWRHNQKLQLNLLTFRNMPLLAGATQRAA